MEPHQKQGILSFLGGLGVIILVAGIFIDGIPFWTSLYVAIVLWMLTGVVAKFFGISRDGDLLNTDWKNGLVALVGTVGVIVFLSWVFLDVPFSIALIVAIAFWLFSGVLASFLNVNNKRKYSYKHSIRNKSSYYSPTPISGSNNYESYESPYIGTKTASDGPAKHLCPRCGSSMQKEDTFCSNCGSALSSPF